jgi:hypothetical protein
VRNVRTKAPSIVVTQAHGDIYALGDVHGDFERMAHLLRRAGVIDKVPNSPETIRWAAGDAVLVCTGDLIDKGKQSLRVLAAIRALQRDASRTGGQVVVTMGNHEAEFLAHPANNKDGEFREEIEKSGRDLAAIATGTDAEGIGAFLRDLPFAARVNDWFFAHSGNTKGLTLERLRAELEAGVNRDGFGARVLSDEDSLLKARLHKHPWWEQPGDADGEGKQRLRHHMSALGASHLVIGHQPGEVQFADGRQRRQGEMYEAYNGLLFLIDVGMSSAIDHSKGAVLRIHGRDPVRATAIDDNGATTRLWTQE